MGSEMCIRDRKRSKKHVKRHWCSTSGMVSARQVALDTLYRWHVDGETNPEFSGEFCPMDDPTADMEELKELCDTVGIEYEVIGDDEPIIRYDKEQAVIREFLTSKAKQSLITELKALEPHERTYRNLDGVITNNVDQWVARFEAAGVGYELTDYWGRRCNISSPLHKRLKFDPQLLK